MIDINCDMGEGIGNDEALMPFINAANIACGYHAGDEATMQQVINLCLKYNVHIGAHPSFLDRANFGRTAMQLSSNEIYNIVTTQLGILNNVANNCNAKLHHVKPHGALYNMAAKDSTVAKSIAQAVKDFDAALIYVGLSGSMMIEEANKLGLHTAHEVFADRTYQNDGSLTPRTQHNALLTSKADVIKQVQNFATKNKVIAVTGEEVFIKADTLCIHGDGAHALEFAQAIHEYLYEK